MKRKLLVLLSIIIFLLGALGILVVFALRQGDGTAFTSGQAAYGYDNFLVDMRNAKGAENVSVIGESPNDIFPTKPNRISIGQEQVDVYEFSNSNETDNNAKKLSSDGLKIEGYGTLEWGDNPHFYKKGKVIVFYVGKDSSTVSLLEGVFGRQFAGK